MVRKHLIFWMGGLVLVLSALLAADIQEQKSGTEAEQARDIQVRGRIVCLSEEMHKLYDADLPAGHEHLYGFKTEDGVFYTLLRTNMSEALFIDKRLHKKELIIKGRTFPKTHILEAMTLYSIHDGGVHELYYYCETCAIRASAPSECECCQEPVELVEKRIGPLTD
jgi:hypothetical protein